MARALGMAFMHVLSCSNRSNSSIIMRKSLLLYRYVITRKYHNTTSTKVTPIAHDDLIDLVNGEFPPVAFACAYGSGAFIQSGNEDMSKNMLDLLFAVDDPVTWHADNITRHRDHYSSLASFGPSTVATVGNMGAKVYYNTIVRCRDRLIKYGVTSVATMEDDLRNWRTLFISGRLHKPVAIIHAGSQEIRSATMTNCDAAVAAALLLSPATLTWRDLFICIAGLSYSGDFRMKFGENPHKVQNIVDGSLDHFYAWYDNAVGRVPSLRFGGGGDEGALLHQNMSPTAKLELVKRLPLSVQTSIASSPQLNKLCCNSNLQENSIVSEAAVIDPSFPDVLSQVISDIVKNVGISQAVMGILSGGPIKSVRYASRKVIKMHEGIKSNSS